MALNVISNFAASVAHRNLQATDARATDSLTKLSSGTRVVTAKDDAASLAIGKGLEVEVESLKQAQVNAGQAQSMLQIADGALSTVSDILTRMKALSVQASSGQYSATERSFLNDEFATLRSEIDRIAQDTEFNGTTLLNGSATFTAGTIGTAIDADDGVEQFVFASDPGGNFVSNTDTLEIDFAANVMTVTNQVTGTSQTVAGITAAPAAGEFLDVNFSDFGLTVQLNSQFNAGSTIAANNEFIASSGGTANSLQLTFRVGTGTGTTDEVSFNLQRASVSNLDAQLSTADLTTVATAEAAMNDLDTAVDKINDIRAEVGTQQNRIGFASANLASSVENTEAARSNLLDLDVAKEISTFTSEQILMQAGVSMLAQANQMPQNLLSLLQ
jgi:flagellin